MFYWNHFPADGLLNSERTTERLQFYSWSLSQFNSEETLDRDLGFMKRLQLNSTRVWLSQRAYESNPEEYINRVLNYVRSCYKNGITVMPILFNGTFPALLEKNAKAGCEKYVSAIVNALKNEEGLLMWDIMNEPEMNDYYRKAPPEEQQKRNDEIADFVRYFITYVKKIDPVNAVTVGHWIPKFCGNTNRSGRCNFFSRLS